MTPQARRLLISGIAALVITCITGYAVTYSASSTRDVTTSGGMRVYERHFARDEQVRIYWTAGYIEWLLINAHAKLFERSAPPLKHVVTLESFGVFVCFPPGALLRAVA